VALAYGVGIVDASSIDSMGILPATFKAMREAIEHAVAGGLQPALVMVDGNLLVPSLALAQRAFVKGDGRSRNIAAASILAKVTRDRMMVEYDAKWPQYGFARHKGYGTSAHMRAIEVAGPCPIHRRSFRPVSEWVEPPAGM
jgi:ribonuclease HII